MQIASPLPGNIEDQLPPFKLPNFTTVDEEGHVVDFPGMIRELNVGLLVIPLISILENVAIAKSFCE